MFNPDEILRVEVASKVPGFAAAVAVEGKLVWSRECGFADIQAKEPVLSTTRFRIGSVSKPLTSAGVALLVEQGKLDLDAPVQKYIPDFPGKGAVITPRMLAGHLSGIRNYRGTEVFTNPPVASLREGLKIFENDPLESMPGAKFSYASYNWNMLGAVMEAAANQEFLAFMDEHVLRPLGLDNTMPELSGKPISHCAGFTRPAHRGIFLPLHTGTSAVCGLPGDIFRQPGTWRNLAQP